jgi:hypothetical protein
MEGKTVRYFSTIRGIEEQQTKQDTVYYGSVLTFEGDMGDEEQYSQHMSELGEEIKQIVANLEERELVIGDVFEVYQVFDSAVEDRSHTFIRVPTTPKQAP